MPATPLEKPTPLLCLDLDGTVRHGKDELGHFVNTKSDVKVFPEAVEMMSRWKKGGGRIIAVSNQGGIAMGHLTMADCMDMMIETQRQVGSLFDKILWCQHHPQAENPEFQRCWCRKPSPGLIIEGAIEISRKFNEMYPPYMGLMVGDRLEDEKCAELAGFDFMWADQWRAQANVG